MSLLNRLSVGQRLAAGFGLLSILLLGVCALGILNAQRAKHVINVEMTSVQERLDLADRLVTLQLTRDVQMRHIGLLGDADEMQRHAGLARASGKDMTATLAKLAEREGTDEERELIKVTQQLNTQYGPISEKAIAMALAFFPEEAAKILTTNLAALSGKQREKIERYAVLQRERGQRASAALSSDTSRAALLMLIAAVVGLTCAVGAGWVVSRSITHPLKKAVELADQVAAGNLGVSLKHNSTDEIGALIRSLDRMATRLRDVISTINVSSERIRSASGEIASGNQNLSARTEQQASALQQTTSTIEQLSESVKRTAEAARNATHLASEASREAGVGGQRVSDVVSTMDAISHSSRKISDIVSVIDAIAFQTNILALNAAVEAARAGEQGRGFAVVASEVRNLAQRSATSAREIKSLIAANVEKVDQGSKLVGDAGQTVAAVVNSAARVAELISQISNATSEQASGLLEVSQAVSSIDQGTQQNAALVEESAAAAESLKEQAIHLNTTVGGFRLYTDAAA